MVDRLNANGMLAVGNSLVSQDGRSTLILQGDGNLVLYRTGGKARWATNTNGKAVSRAIMQGDGNLVLYAGDEKTPLWASGTNGHPGAWLTLQNDGNLVVYDAAGKPLWDTATNILEAAVAGFTPSRSALHFTNSWPPGTPYPLVTFPVVGAITLDAAYGLCGGFVFTALDMFLHNPRLQPPPDVATPAAGTPIFKYLSARLVDSVIANSAKFVEWVQLPGHDVGIPLFGPGLAHRIVTDEWPAIKRDIDSGKPSPLFLVMGPQCGPLDIPGIVSAVKHAHQVLAYRYALDGHDLTLYVYDCNDPANDASVITCNIANPRATLAIAAPAIEAVIADPAPIRGFFRAAYAPKDPSEALGIPMPVPAPAPAPPPTGLVPKVLGLVPLQALNTIKEAGFMGREAGGMQTSNDGLWGRVVNQEPSPSTPAPAGATVTFQVGVRPLRPMN